MRDMKKVYKNTTKWKKKAYKRIPFEVRKEFFFAVLEPAASEAGESVNGYIKKAVDARLNLSEEEVNAKIEAYLESLRSSDLQEADEGETECDGDSCPIHYPE